MLRRCLTLAAAVLLVAALAAPVTAEDSLRGRQWGLEQVDAPRAWPVTRGAGATVAVVDSGLDLDNPEFASRIVGGATFVGCPNAPDGCGDGDLRSGEDPEPSVHGTHVAGIVGAVDDGHGVTGVAPEALLLAVKVLAGDGEGRTVGATEDIAAGIRWAVRNGADVVNLSLAIPTPGGGQALAIFGAFEPMETAIRDAVSAGVVVVAAAGNESAPLCDEPAFDPQVLCVVATDRLENRAAYSNFGANPGLNVVSAPGGALVLACEEDVLSVFPVGTSDPGCPQVPAGYGYLAGTSMAAPHVAGIAAMLVATGRRGNAVVDRLLETARNPLTGARGSYDPTYGFGIVDADEAVGEPTVTVVRRHAGEGRVATAVAVSQQSHPDGAPAVVLARADDYADALAGAPFAVHHDAPLLLSAREELSATAREEIERLGADTAYLLGGEAALSQAVADQLRADGLEVERVSGASRWATAAAVAARLPAGDVVYVVEGADPDPQRGWPDALSVSGLAAAFSEPILLTLTASLPAATADAVGSDSDVVIVGGTASVSAAVEDELRARAASVRRLAGRDRYQTSVAVAEEALSRGASPATLWLASGLSFPDGLAAGAAAGAAGGTFLLVHGQDLDASPATRDHLAEEADRLEVVHLAGGRAAISAEVEQRIRDLVS